VPSCPARYGQCSHVPCTFRAPRTRAKATTHNLGTLSSACEQRWFATASFTRVGHRGGSTRWGDTNPKYMDPVDRRLRGCLTKTPLVAGHTRIINQGTHRAGFEPARPLWASGDFAPGRRDVALIACWQNRVVSLRQRRASGGSHELGPSEPREPTAGWVKFP